MPLYKILRNVGDISPEDLDAAAFRAIVCAGQFTGLRWQRSFWNAEAGTIECLYEAENVRDLEEHARISRIPCDAVSEVREILPQTYLNG